MAFALRNQLPEIPDGVYDISVDGHDVEFQVYTCSTGNLRDQRIVKMRRAGSNSWKGFANLKVEEDSAAFAGLYIWQTMRAEVSETWAIRVSRAIRAFIFRVNQGIMSLSDLDNDFIVINDCPVIPQHLNANLRYERERAERETREAEFRRHRNEELARQAREEAATNRNRIAMSFFHPEVVR